MKLFGRASGSVLAQVLIMSLLMAILAAGLIRMAMNQYTVAINTKKNAKARQYEAALINTVESQWTASGGDNCYPSTPNVSCTPGTQTTCNCTCTVSPDPLAIPPATASPCTAQGTPQVQASQVPAGTPCKLTVINVDDTDRCFNN